MAIEEVNVDAIARAAYLLSMTLELTPALERSLEQIAGTSHRSAQELAVEAIEGYVAHQRSLIAAIEEGQAAAGRGDMVDHDDVMAMMDEIILHG